MPDLVRRGFVRAGGSKAEALADLLAFFGVSSPKAWERYWAHAGASFREAPAFKSSPEAVSVWLRWGEIKASEIECKPFDAKRFRAALKTVRRLTTEKPFSSVIDEVRSICASCGVALVLLPELAGTHLSGAPRWLTPSKALIGIPLATFVANLVTSLNNWHNIVQPSSTDAAIALDVTLFANINNSQLPILQLFDIEVPVPEGWWSAGPGVGESNFQ